MILKGYTISVIYALLCLACAFVLYKFGVAKKITRKLVHIFVGFEWIILYHFMGVGVHFLVVCLAFFAILFISYRKKLMPMISSDGDNSPGTVYYAVAMSVMALICLFVPDMMLPFGIGVICTSGGDGIAGLVGQSIPKRINPKMWKNKSLFGTLANFVFCFLGILFFKSAFSLEMSIGYCIAVAAFSVELELFTGKGLDNISITLGTSFLSYFLLFVSGAENYLVPILLTPLVIALSHEKRALTKGGIIAAVFIDIVVSVAFKNFGFILLLFFLAGGVVTDKIKKMAKKQKQNSEDVEKRGDCRDWVQVLSNGFAPAISAVLYLALGSRVFLFMFVASLSEALSDTVASGIGAFAKNTFDVARFKRIDGGLSGGVSLLGTLASLLSSFIIPTVAFFFGAISASQIHILAVLGFLGAVFDSLLGSLVQVKYVCSACGKITEKGMHCETKTKRHSGIVFVTNDFVNLLGTLFSALAVYFIFI